MHPDNSLAGLRAAALLVTALVTSLLVPHRANSAATGQPVAYVVTPNSTVTVVDTGNHQVINTLTLDTPTTNSRVVGRPDGTKIYVTGEVPASSTYFVRVIDTRTGTTAKKIPLPASAIDLAISADGTRLYVLTDDLPARDNGAVTVIDTAADTIVSSITDSRGGATGLAVSPDGKRVYVSLAGSGGADVFGAVDVIDTTSGTVIDSPTLGDGDQMFYSVAVSADSAKFYSAAISCCTSNYDAVVAFDAATRKFTGPVAGLTSDAMLGLPLPSSSTVYGANGGSLVLLNTQTNKVAQQVPVATRINAFALTPDHKQLYLATTNTQSLSIVDTASNAVTGTVAVAGATSVAIIAAPPPPANSNVTVTLAVSPASIPQGAQAAITWSSTNATSCVPSGGWTGPVTLQGSSTISPPSAGTYNLMLTCTGSTGSASAVAKLVVTRGSTLTLSSSDIPVHASSTVTWSAFPGATACSAGGTAWGGSLPTSGSKVLTPQSAGTYTVELTCTTPSGLSATTSQTLTVFTPGAAQWTNLSPTDTIYAVQNFNAPTTGGGIDGHGYAFFPIGSPLTAFGQTFVLGAITQPTAASGASIALGSVPLSQVTLVATAVNGNQLNQPFVVTYSDGTHATFTQNLSDWGRSQKYPGETVALESTSRVTPAGTLQNGTWFLYAYQFKLDPTKIAVSLQLPKNRNVVVLAANETVVPQSQHNSLAAAYNVEALASAGRAATGPRMGSGYGYDASLVPSGFTGAGQSWAIGPKDQPDAVSNTTIPLPAKKTVSLTVLATAVNGSQPNQTFVVTYQDGSTTRLTQGVSDWRQPQNYAGETLARSTASRITPTGASQAGPWNLYAYTFQTDANKPIASLTLPANRNVVVLAVNSSTQ